MSDLERMLRVSVIKKAIIPAAGLGTRFLPATKAMPKEMLPIVDKPTIQYIVEEAVKSGIEDIIIVTGKGKRAIEDHFDHAFELEMNLLDKGKFELLEEVRHSSNIVDIHYIRQKEPKGLGHAIWCARKFIGNEPFAVLLGDDIVRSEVPCLKQMIEQFEQHQCPIIAVQGVPDKDTHRYGIIDVEQRLNNVIYRVESLVEKPAEGTAPSNLAIIGRYILTPDIFTHLNGLERGACGEIQLTGALNRLNQVIPILGYKFTGERFDVGEKLGYILTTLEFALNNPELRSELLQAMRRMIDQDMVKPNKLA